MDIDRLSNLCMDISTEWRDVQIIYTNKKYKEKVIIVPLIITGSNGVYVFLEENCKEDINNIYQQLEKLFSIRGDGLYVFCAKNDGEEDDDEIIAWAYDSMNKEFIELEDLYEAFDIFYYNHYIPQAELPYYNFNSFKDYFEVQEVSIERDMEVNENDVRYVRPILSSDKVKFVEEKLSEILSSGRKEGKYTYYEDGSMTVNKIVRSNDYLMSMFDSYLPQKTYDYPCSEEDGNKTFLITVLGGWFGLHKFRAGKILQGILYLISCGGCCMFYFLDTITVMTGNYFTEKKNYFRNEYGKVDRTVEKTYNRPVKNKKLFLIFPIMALVSFCLVKFAYVPAYEYGSNAAAKIVESVYSEYINKNNNIEGLDGISADDIGKYVDGLEIKDTTESNN